MPVHKNYSLNLIQSRHHLSIMGSRPTEFPDSSAFYKPESAGAGGSHFSYTRQFRNAVYAKDCLPIQNGFASVCIEEICTVNLATGGMLCKGEYITDCRGHDEVLMLYDHTAVSNISTHPLGSVIHYRKQNGLSQVEAVLDDPTNCNASLKPLTLEGVMPEHDDVLGMEIINGRTILWTDSQIYYNGGEHFFDLTPKLRTGAGSNALLADIGSIVNILQSGTGLYIFGTRGAVYGAKTADIQMPYDYEPVRNHSGIPNREAVQTDYDAEALLVWAHDGLQYIKGIQATPVFPEVTYDLLRGSISELYYPTDYDQVVLRQPGLGDSEEQMVSSPISLETYDKNEYQDEKVLGEGLCTLAPFYREYELKSCFRARVSVNNLDARYCTVSYGSTTDVQEREDEGNYHYSRLLVIDKLLDRMSFIHFEHTDVIRRRHKGREPFVIINCDKAYCVKLEEGVASLLFHEFQRTRTQHLQIGRISLYGDFNHENYDKWHKSWLSTIPFGFGIDQTVSEIYLGMTCTGYSHRKVDYAGRARNPVLSFVIPFSGRLTEAVCEYT